MNDDLSLRNHIISIDDWIYCNIQAHAILYQGIAILLFNPIISSADRLPIPLSLAYEKAHFQSMLRTNQKLAQLRALDFRKFAQFKVDPNYAVFRYNDTE